MEVSLAGWRRSGRIGTERAVHVAAIIIAGYIAAIAGAEAAVAFWGALPGTLWHAAIILALVNHSIAFSQAPPDRHDEPNAARWFSRTLPVLMLAPLLRILSLTMPFRYVPQVYWYVMIGIPALLSALLAVRFLHLSAASLGLQLRLWRAQVIIALSGVPLSYTAYDLFGAKRSIADSAWYQVLAGSAILLVFGAFTEEIIFRGLFQRVAEDIFGSRGVAWSSALFAVMYIGSGRPTYVLFMGLVGLYLGWCVHRTGSIWGVVVAHGLLNIGLLIIWPILL